MHKPAIKYGLGLASIIVALLLARLVALLFAADPSQPFVQFVVWITQPLLLPVAWIDAHQPTIGVRFERGTLILAVLIVLLVGVGSALRRRKRTVDG